MKIVKCLVTLSDKKSVLNALQTYPIRHSEMDIPCQNLVNSLLNLLLLPRKNPALEQHLLEL